MINICLELELTEDEVGVLKAAVLDERARLWKFIDRRQAWDKKVNPKVLAGLDTLDRLIVKLGKESNDG